MISEEFEDMRHALARGARHRIVARTPATAQTNAVPVSTDDDAESDLGAVAELGYN